MNTLKHHLKKRIQTGIFLFLLSVLIIFLCRNPADVSAILRQIQPVWLLPVIGMIILSNLLKAVSWAFFTRAVGCTLSYTQLVAIWHYSMAGSYIPGSVWMMAGRVYQLRRLGFSSKKSVYAVGLEQIVTLAAAAFIVLITPDIRAYIRIPQPLGLLCAATVLGIVLHPQMWGKLLWTMRIRVFDFRLIPKTSVWVDLGYFFGIVLAYYLVGSAVLLMLKLFQWDAPQMHLFNATAMPAAAFMVGYLSFLTPNGIGVKEGVLTVFLQFHMPLTTAVLFAVSLRLWAMAANFITIGLSHAYLKTNDMHPFDDERIPSGAEDDEG
jgi:hypothetical protein